MRCEDAGERITALVDGELPPAERAELEAHLSGCARCRDARAAEEAVAARLRSAARPPLPAGFAASVMAKVPAAAPSAAASRGRILPLWPLVAAASAVAAAVVAMVTIGPGDGGFPAKAPHLETAEGFARRGAVPGGDAGSGPPPPSAPEEEEKSGKKWLAEAKKLDERGADKDAEGRRAASEDARPGRASEGGEADDATAATAKGPPAPAPSGDPPARETAADGEESRDLAKSEEAQSKARGGVGAKAPEAKAAGEKDLPAPGVPVREDVGLLASEVQPERTSLFFAAKTLGEGRQSVEGVLLAARDVSQRGGPWKSVADLDTEVGRLRKNLEGRSAGNQEVARFPEDHVLELRVRRADLPRIEQLLEATPGLKRVAAGMAARDAGAGEVAQALRRELERLDKERESTRYKGPAGEVPAPAVPKPDAGGAAAAAGGAPVGRPAPPPAEAPKPPASKGDGAAGPAPVSTPVPPAPNPAPPEPVPPPMPSKEQLKSLEEAPPEARKPPAASPSDEVVVEIHVLVVPDLFGK
jgi:hypothetical protein